MIKHKKNKLLSIITIILIVIFTSSCVKENNQEEPIIEDNTQEEVIEEETKEEEIVEPEIEYYFDVLDEGEIISYASESYYRYGPSIMKYEDGSMDVWFSSPGNNSTEWDYITYRHSDDGVNWSDEKIVLKPTPGSKDQCSVCDPGLIYFDGYYYLGYTATDNYDAKGLYNMAFVARSTNPDGPYEKWNGSGWGGNPEPIIFFGGSTDNWGVGELSFVIYDNDLCIYYSYVDIRAVYIGLYKADLTENWPSTMRNKGAQLGHLDHDSVDVVYDEDLETFFAFTIDNRLMESSRVSMYQSYNGKEFEFVCSNKDMIEDYAHNMGISKGRDGHIHSNDNQLIGYAYGPDWGRWNTRFQSIQIGKRSVTP